MYRSVLLRLAAGELLDSNDRNILIQGESDLILRQKNIKCGIRAEFCLVLGSVMHFARRKVAGDDLFVKMKDYCLTDVNHEAFVQLLADQLFDICFDGIRTYTITGSKDDVAEKPKPHTVMPNEGTSFHGLFLLRFLVMFIMFL